MIESPTPKTRHSLKFLQQENPPTDTKKLRCQLCVTLTSPFTPHNHGEILSMKAEVILNKHYLSVSLVPLHNNGIAGQRCGATLGNCHYISKYLVRQLSNIIIYKVPIFIGTSPIHYLIIYN